MPIIDQFLNYKINENRLNDNIKDRDGYTPSGKLSAGSLYLPTRFQLLKTLGVEREPFDAYTLGVFDKGNQVEDSFIYSLQRISAQLAAQSASEKKLFLSDEEHKELLKEKFNLEWDEEKKQYKSTYRDCIGYVDSIIDTDLMEAKKGIMPFEVKSVTSYKYKHVKKQGGGDWHHCLQACQNALGMGIKYFGLVYISKEHDDPHIMIYQVREFKNDVDKIISNYKKALENWANNRELPAFELDSRVKWLIPNYSPFEEFWYQAPDSEVIKKLEEINLI